mmetsp:Transcript_68834/g.206440  ORF Transcript_68834/g.206440 Transcript_68834/m.206440 type:complete len:145 (+) Transcript_68834:766-1200(+)
MACQCSHGVKRVHTASIKMSLEAQSVTKWRVFQSASCAVTRRKRIFARSGNLPTRFCSFSHPSNDQHNAKLLSLPHHHATRNRKASSPAHPFSFKPAQHDLMIAPADVVRRRSPFRTLKSPGSVCASAQSTCAETAASDAPRWS